MPSRRRTRSVPEEEEEEPHEAMAKLMAANLKQKQLDVDDLPLEVEYANGQQDCDRRWFSDGAAHTLRGRPAAFRIPKVNSKRREGVGGTASQPTHTTRVPKRGRPEESVDLTSDGDEDTAEPSQPPARPRATSQGPEVQHTYAGGAKTLQPPQAQGAAQLGAGQPPPAAGPGPSQSSKGVPMSVLLKAIQQHPNLKSRIQEIVSRTDYSEPQKMTAIQRVVQEKSPGFTLPPPMPAMNAVAGSNHEEEVAVVGERTFAQRDAECRKRAIDLEAETPRKRGRGASAALEERVVSARSVCTAAVDKRVRELIQPAFEQFAADQIDAAELDRLKTEARVKATAEQAQLTELERASAEYTEAVTARTKAEAAEDAAEAKLEAVLRGLERSQPGPSGVKAE